MCGLAGMAALATELPSGADRIATAMAGCLEHRGPDAGNTWADEHVAIAHRRLSIIDLSETGSQPMHSASGRFVLAFNGEIYNHQDLRARLGQEGWNPRGTSDTEILLAGIESWGLYRCLQLADGMFAFALLDRRERRISLVRDRFGEKPLAYCDIDGRLVFASELSAFTKIPGFDHSLDPSATAAYFRYGYVPGRATIYTHVRKVPPATVIEYKLRRASEPKEWRYWETPGPASAAGDGSIDEQLAELLSGSVRRRLVADRAVGAFLSGGIDSSLICALAARHTDTLTTFHMGWDVAEHDESELAAAVASALGADHHAVSLSRADAVAAVQRLPAVMDEPFADPSQLSMLLVSTIAREHVVVSLSGDGGDELFGGYNRHRWLLHAQRLQRRLPTGARAFAARALHRIAPLAGTLLRPLPTTHRPRLVADKVHKLGRVMAAPTLSGSYQSLLAVSGDVGSPVELPTAVELALASEDPDTVLWGLRAADIASWLPDDVLVKVDRASMAVSLESRAPFLQPDIAALAMGLGSDQLLGRDGGKQPLRRLLRSLLPEVPFDQKKTGFGMPADSLLRAELAGLLASSVDSHRARRSPVDLDWAGLHAGFQAGDDAAGPMLWSLLMFELWAEDVGHEVTWT